MARPYLGKHHEPVERAPATDNVRIDMSKVTHLLLRGQYLVYCFGKGNVIIDYGDCVEAHKVMCYVEDKYDMFNPETIQHD